MSEKMQAWQLPRPGPVLSNLKLRDDLPKPSEASVGDNEVLLQVIAASVNPADYKVAELGIIARAIVSFPKTPGMDLSGRVIAVGSKVTDLAVGDLVSGRISPFAQYGALSQFVIAQRSNIAKLPSSADAVLASGLGTAALTAYQTIAPYVKADQGHEVFINGGSGGVGTLGIQVAKTLGCRVTVTCSTSKIELCKELGADVIIDYTKEDVIAKLKERGQVFSVVADNVCNSPSNLYPESQHFLKPGSPYVFVGGKMSFASVSRVMLHLLTPSFLGGRQRPYVQYITKDNQEHLEQVTQWFAEGKLRVITDQVFDFKDAAQAIELVKKGSSKGKVIVKM